MVLIKGKVFDVDIDELLIGVIVIVVGIGFGIIIDFDGNYVIGGLLVGEYKVEFIYIGFVKMIEIINFFVG